MDLEKYRNLFIEEATEHLQDLSRCLLTLEKQPGDAEALDEAFRMAHSVKGMAASLSYDAVTELAHALEDRLQLARDAGRISKNALGPFFRGLEALERMVGHVRETGTPPDPDPALVAELADVPPAAKPAARSKPRSRSKAARAPSAPAAPGAPAAKPGRAAAKKGPSGPRTRADDPRAGAAEPPRAPAVASTVRVRTATLDRFLSAVGEVILSSSQLRTTSESSRETPSHEVTAGFDRMERVVGELQRRALDLRTTPLQRVIDPLPRVARETAERAGKRVEVVTRGGELELDRSILDRLADPLVHVVRNAVDHGIEKPDVRRAAGKSPEGALVIEGRREKDAIRVEVCDDGAGIDLESVRARAIETGLVHPDLAADLPPEEIAAFIFQPGLSTAASVSEISGRGVGMDAVRSTLESLGGNVEIATTAGQGTTTTLRVPITAAVQRVLIVELGREKVAIPIARVERLLELPARALERSGHEEFALIDDEPIPVLDLAALLGLPSFVCGDTVPVVLTDLRGERTALRVARVAGHQEIYVKPVPRLLLGVRALAGMTLLGDGRPVFVLDLNQLL